MPDRKPLTHFGQRAAERGISSVDGDRLKGALEWAIRAGRDDLVSYVMDQQDGTAIYRFRVPEGVFYAVAHRGSGNVLTCLTQRMVGAKKWTRKMRKRGKLPREVERQRA